MSLLKVAGTTASSGTLYVDDVFSTYLYTGNGSTQTITNGIDLAGKGGLVWNKDRTSANGHWLEDTAQGAGYALQSNNTGASAYFSSSITSFNSNGFSLGGTFNVNGDNMASWTFRKAAKFFDVVTYTGTGSAQTIAHSLGVAPGMVIVKSTSNSEWWAVQHISLGATKSLYLNSTNAQETNATNWNNTSPTSSVFTVGTNTPTNDSGQTYVAYLFAHDTSSTGIIQCGSFTTDAGGNATVNLGWEPQYVMIKAASTTSPWYIIDSMRAFNLTSSARLFANSSQAEAVAATAYVNPTATGFQVNNGMLSANQTYIYMAIRMPNKPPTTGTQVFSPQIATGNGTSNTITTNFAVDMVIDAPRNQGGTSRYAFDRLRGNGNWLVPNDTSAEFASGSTLINFANNTGFINANWGAVSGASYVDWSFKRAPGFFDEVCWTGTSATPQQINHNLGVAPELIITKRRDAVSGWPVYNKTITASKYLVLHDDRAASAAGSTFWENTEPTASVFTAGQTVSPTNATIVAYLFATLAGISKVGSYTGNGTGQAIACGFSTGARFVLIKRTDSTGNWYTFDSARGLTVGSSPYLLLNSTAAETTGDNGVYASTGGFTLGATAITTTNIATATYIFLAVS